MPDEPTQTPNGETNPAAPAASGSVNDPSQGGVPAGYVPQASLEQAEARRRSLQSELDKERVKNTGLTDRLARVEEMMAGFNPDAIADQFTARFNQQQALAAERTTLRQEFTLARPDVIDAQYATPEEMRAAIEASHKAEADYRASIRESVQGEFLAQLKEQHGIDLAPAPQTPADPESGGTGEVTAKDIASMGLDDLLALDDAAYAKALRS